MTPAAVADRAQHVADVRALDGADSDSIKSAMVATRQIAAWADAQHAALICQLTAVESFPEAAIAEVSRGSLSYASRGGLNLGPMASLEQLRSISFARSGSTVVMLSSSGAGSSYDRLRGPSSGA